MCALSRGTQDDKTTNEQRCHLHQVFILFAPQHVGVAHTVETCSGVTEQFPKITILCRALVIASLGCMQPVGSWLDIGSMADPLNFSLTCGFFWNGMSYIRDNGWISMPPPCQVLSTNLSTGTTFLMLSSLSSCPLSLLLLTP